MYRNAEGTRVAVGKVWVLDTDTKGTGAEMVPLEKVEEQPAPKERAFKPARRKARPPREPDPAQPKRAPRFKVVDVMTRRVLADGADTRATVDLLEGVRSAVDVTIYAWDHAQDAWRKLSHAERRTLWGMRGR